MLFCSLHPYSLPHKDQRMDIYTDVNKKLCKVAPVLSSQYVRYLLHRDRWLEVFETINDGSPTFISTNEIPRSLLDLGTIKADYVWGSLRFIG